MKIFTSLFISYRRDDKIATSKIVQKLRARGFQIWLDETHIPGGAGWREAAFKGIDDCHFVLVMLTPDACRSPQVKEEVDYARKVGRRIIPLQIKQCTAAELQLLGLGSANYINFVASEYEGWRKLFSPLNIGSIGVRLGWVVPIIGTLALLFIVGVVLSRPSGISPTVTPSATIRATSGLVTVEPTSTTGITSATSITSVPGQCPEGRSVVNGLLVPSIIVRPIVRDALPKYDRTPLYPVPSDDNLNPALYTRIPRTAQLHILARADPKFGGWLYVELDIPEKGAEFGFIRRENTDFSGSMNEFPIIDVQSCVT